MKLYSIIALILLLTMLFVPLFSLLGDSEKNDTAPSEITSQQVVEEKDTQLQADTLRVLRTSSGKVESVDMKSYVVCSVASEMPPDYNAEALKAQAVVSYTYALYLIGSPYSESADITDSPSTHQAYKSKEELKEKWGDKYDEYISAIEAAVSQVEGEYLTYNGAIVKPAYHAMSSGRTNSALDVWGEDVPYLQSVASDGDKLSAKFISTYDFSRSEMIKLLSSCSDKKFDDIIIGDFVTNSGGYVKQIEISGETFSGEKLRSVFSLRSAAFTLSQSEDTYTFTCTGYGHGVGMSQNGAQYMAQNGSTYDEILEHYYTGIEIKS